MTKDIWIARLAVNDYRMFGEKDWNNDKVREKWRDLQVRFQQSGSLANIWEEVAMEFFPGEPGEEDEEQKLPVPDFSNGRVADALNERARRLVEPLVTKQVEFLPLITPVGPYYEMNIQRLDCLDVQNSVVKRFEDGRIMRVIKYAFWWDRLEGQHIFWIQGLGKTPTLVSSEFKQLVEENKLTGLKFFSIPLAED